MEHMVRVVARVFNDEARVWWHLIMKTQYRVRNLPFFLLEIQ